MLEGERPRFLPSRCFGESAGERPSIPKVALISMDSADLEREDRREALFFGEEGGGGRGWRGGEGGGGLGLDGVDGAVGLAGTRGIAVDVADMEELGEVVVGGSVGEDLSKGISTRSKVSSNCCSPSVMVTMVSIVLALSVLVLIVVSEAVLEPMTTTLGTARQLRLPPADLKCNLRRAEAACDRRSPSRDFSVATLLLFR